MPVAHLRCAAAKPMRQAEEIAVLLERRIDQHQAAALLRRHVGAERGPAVDFQRLDAGIPAQILPQRDRRLRLDLAGDQAVLRAQPGARQRRRAGIES